MANIQAFRGVRYDLARVGRLAEVVAPPYDVIDAEMQQALVERHPQNVVRLELPQREEGESDENRYRRAGVLWRNWRREGILQTDSRPALYVCHQLFELDGQLIERRGFYCRLGLERFGEGKVFPHEETHSSAKQDRLHLMRETKANFSPIFGLYEDPWNEIQTLLEGAIEDSTPIEAIDSNGVRHLLWMVTDIATIAQAADLLGERAIFIADGHHRYETACQYRDELASASGGLPTDHPANYLLACCFGMSDPGLVVLPTHRLFRSVPPISSRELTERLGEAFDCSFAGHGPEAASNVWSEIELEGEQSTLGIYTKSDDTWTLIRLTTTGWEQMQRVSASSPRWNGLGVSLLHRLVIEELLGLNGLPAPAYVRNLDELVTGITLGDVSGRDATGQLGTQAAFELAAIGLPASVEDVEEISLLGERMPAKSTFFFPKLLTGLVMNPLE
jgi:uncharacterized protein (DUF1015 family)